MKPLKQTSRSDDDYADDYGNADEEKEFLVKDLSRDEGQYVAKGKKINKISLPTVVWTLINSIINRNLLSLPFAVAKFGIPSTIVLFIVSGFLSWCCSALCRRAKNFSHHASYTSVAKFCFGKEGHVATWIFVVIHAVGRSTSYLIVFFSTLEDLLKEFFDTCAAESPSFICTRPAMIVLVFLVLFPFHAGTFHRLAIPSFVKFLAVITFTLCVAGYSLYAVTSGQNQATLRMGPDNADAFTKIEIVFQVVLAFNFLTNQYSLYKQMEKPSDDRVKIGVSISLSFAVIIYSLVGFFVFMVIGDQTQKNFFKNLKSNEVGVGLYVVIYIAFLILLLASLPVTYFSARNTIYQTVAKKLVGNEKDISLLGDRFDENGDEEFDTTPKETIAYYAVVFISTAIVVIVAGLSPGADDAFELLGYITSTGIFFLLPIGWCLALKWRKHKTLVAAGTFITLALIAIFLIINSNLKESS